MRGVVYLYVLLTAVALAASLGFFFECIHFLAARDYVSAILLFFIGLCLSRVASDLARLGLASGSRS